MVLKVSDEQMIKILSEADSNQEVMDALNCSEASVSRARRQYKIPLKNHKKKETKESTLVDFLSRGRTIKEIQNKFKLNEKEIKTQLSEVPETLDVFWTRNNFQEEIVVVIPKPEEFSLEKPIWTFSQQPDGEPYLWVKFDKTPKWDKIKVVPLADIHFGAFAHDKEKFLEYVNWIKNTDNVFAFIDGDVLEHALGDSCKGKAVHEQEIRPRTQRDKMVEILSGIAHKIMWAVPGNHEDRSRTHEYDPLEYICKILGIPYFDEPVFVDILWNGYVFDFYCQHGKTNSQTKGGKINSASRPQSFQEFVMFTVMAHVHDAMVNPTVRICRDRVNFKLKFKKQYTIICPSFYKYFKTYASRAAYAPGHLGSVTMDLYRTGDYHANV